MASAKVEKKGTNGTTQAEFRNMMQTTRIRRLEFDNSISMKELTSLVKQKLNISTDILLFGGTKPLSTMKEVHDHLKSTGKKARINVRRAVNLNDLKNLRRKMKIPELADFPYGVINVQALRPVDVRERLVEQTVDFLQLCIADPAKAGFKIPSRSNFNVGYDDKTKMVLMGSQQVERVFRNLSSVQSVVQMAGVMRIIDNILKENAHVTKRELFYQDVNLFEDQRVSDALIEDLGAMLQCTRTSLNVHASAKGKVIGRLTFTEAGDVIDCQKGVGGHAITPMINKIDNMESDAEFVLVIEKDAAFQRLAEDKFFDYVPSIIITASGQPDLATRMFVKKIREDLELPIMGLMDADPYGLDILRVYTIGSKQMSLETSELAVVDIKWLGLLPSDLDSYNISSNVRIPMTKTDTKRAEDLLDEDFVKARPEWKKEIEIMIDTKEKAEIQALASKDLRYLTNVYLPEKLDKGDWV
ncbi:MAG: hypothetical protein ACFFD4_04085 [Candidatus Odinarchaeota archaeon]